MGYPPGFRRFVKTKKMDGRGLEICESKEVEESRQRATGSLRIGRRKDNTETPRLAEEGGKKEESMVHDL